MFNASQINNTNIPSGTATGGFNAAGAGVYNEFATPTIDDGNTNKRDTVKLFLISALILTLLLAAVSYFYANYLASKVNLQKSSLANLDNNPNIITFDKNIQPMRDLSKKIKLINSVNDSRVYFSGMLFPLLESVVESSKTSYVYFDKVSIKKDSVNSTVLINMSGVAQDYLALSRQVSNFRTGPMNGYFLNFKFLSLALSENRVTFDISFNVDISTANYLKFLKSTDGLTVKNNNSSGPLFKNNAPAEWFSNSTSSNQIATTTATSTLKLNNN